MDKRYDTSAEQKWMQRWHDEQLYVCTPEEAEFTIDTPPPTVSGRMHIGHACSYSQEDFYARFWRMKLGKVFYPFGTDDNGLPTERLVERTKRVKSTSMTRKEFRELCLQTVQELRPEFVQDWKRIGMSCDFHDMYSTIDKEAQRVSQKSFLDLYKKGKVYRKETPVAWCVTCQTAIAQVEFDNVDLTSHFNDVIFTMKDKDLMISTTRPELIPACVALAAHPDDDRYAGLKGKHAQVPLCDYEVPIIYDEDVALDKGTGLMMVCTFGDKEDVEKWHKHKLPLRIIFTNDGKLNDLTPYEGMKIREARKQILSDLDEAGFLKDQKQITHPVNVHERCGTEIEFLKTSQWFVRVMDAKEELLEAGRKMEWHPDHMRVRYEHWVENLNWDWCISRQRYYGVPFPVWFKDGEIIVADESQLPVDPIVDRPKGVDDDVDLVPDTDVMDTWATSSVSPEIALGGTELIPMSLRPQAHDIIRTWAFYTIVKSLFNYEEIPWTNVAISGFVTDPKGRKMSKSKGNVVNPQEVLEQYPADAVRFWAAGAKLGDDIPYMEKDLVTGKKTINKLWNASRFVLMHLEEFDGYAGELQVMDRWLLDKYNALVTTCTKAFESYDHSKAKLAVDTFFWNDFCDNYLEIVKSRLYDPVTPEEKQSAQHTLSIVLEGILKLFAPIMPFVTEEIHSHFKEGSIHASAWPEPNERWEDLTARNVGEDIVRAVQAVRKHKSEQQMSMRDPIPVLTVQSTHDIALAKRDLEGVTKAEKIVFKAGEFKVEI